MAELDGATRDALRQVRRPSWYAGAALVTLSFVGVVQTGREASLWIFGQRRFDERSLSVPSIQFGAHQYSITDDQPSAPHSYDEFEGVVQPRVDGAPMGPPSRARVRRGLGDRGRYFGWYDSWIFRERATGDSALWLARRIQATDADSPRFEISRITPDGKRDVVILRGWQLASDFRRYRSAQFIMDGPWSVFPLTFGDAIGVLPLFLLIYPLGTFALGFFFMKGKRHNRLSGDSHPEP